MKEKLTKLSELQAELLIAGSISILILIGAAIGLFFNQPGPIIGAAIGVAVEFFYIWLVSIGSTLSLKESKMGLSVLVFLLGYAYSICSCNFNNNSCSINAQGR